MSFDEQPDGDIHGECAFEIHSLQQQLASCQAALADTEALEIGTGERLAKVEQQLAACERQRDELKADAERYQELLYAVQRKFPNESRHETALRYIKHAEAPSYSNAAKESK